jgi:flagellar motor switch protein FliN
MNQNLTEEFMDNLTNEPVENTNDSDKSTVSVSSSIAQFEEFDDSTQVIGDSDEKLHFLKDLPMNIYIELGRTQMRIKDILELERGYVIELDKLASEPVDVFVNNKKIAEGEVVVIDKHFGIRITSLVDPANRLKDIN